MARIPEAYQATLAHAPSLVRINPKKHRFRRRLGPSRLQRPRLRTHWAAARATRLATERVWGDGLVFSEAEEECLRVMEAHQIARPTRVIAPGPALEPLRLLPRTCQVYQL